MKFFVFSLLILAFTALPFADSIPGTQTDTLFSSADSSRDSVNLLNVSDPDSSIHNPASPSAPLKKDIPQDVKTSDDSLQSSVGIFFGFGSGVTLGDLPILTLWKNSLPDTLEDIGLHEFSFAIFPDTSLPDSLQISDTTKLVFKIKEHPSAYNMTFPLRLSIAKINDKDLLKASLTYSLIYKNHKSLVFTADDTLNRRIDIKQKLFLHSLSLDVIYGRKIPHHYFSIESIEKSYFLIGLGISPLLYLKTEKNVDNQSTDERMAQVSNSILSNSKTVNAFGATFTFKTGITAVRHLSSNGIAEIGLFYSLNYFDYFYKNGNRLNKSDIDRNRNDENKLSFLSNRFEIGVTLYKKHDRK